MTDDIPLATVKVQLASNPNFKLMNICFEEDDWVRKEFDDCLKNNTKMRLLGLDWTIIRCEHTSLGAVIYCLSRKVEK